MYLSYEEIRYQVSNFFLSLKYTFLYILQALKHKIIFINIAISGSSFKYIGIRRDCTAVNSTLSSEVHVDSF